MNKIKQKFENIKEFILDNKKSMILVSSLFLGFLICSGLSNLIVNTFKSELNNQLQEYNNIQNQIGSVSQQINASSTIDSDAATLRESDNINLIGNKVDQGKWHADNDIFWNFISPAYNFKNGSEYNQHIANIKTDLLRNMDPLFVDVVLKPYNEELGTASFQEKTKNHDFDDPIDKDENGQIIYERNQEKYNNALKEDNNNYKLNASRGNFWAYPIEYDDNTHVYTYLAKLQADTEYVEGSFNIYFVYTIDNTDTIIDFKAYQIDDDR